MPDILDDGKGRYGFDVQFASAKSQKQIDCLQP